ncbi:diacylglycerol lipase-beta-like [Branchiostoma floridae]|uniref:Diacylglycerol lipase-beta n=1 Tax=Branchiostoma floridae TaxID=7739 RepID=A0A9J7M948_BRAFL|nr:diacylglycerol lipase-beta-like [Branchiostoma floridae]XP_035694885.1 diacylglycerol lipase-beta-like [Branchiostoma floridae]
MPGLVVFGRRWEIASDDLLFPGGLEIFIRAIWLLAISIVYNEHRDLLKCADGNLLAAYLIGVIVQLCLIIVINAWIVHVSMQGTITNYRPRKQMPSLLYVRFALYIPELAWDIIGTYWTFRDHVGCNRDVVAIVEGAVIFSWIILVITVVGIAVIFDPLGSRNRFSYWPEEQQGLESGETDQLMTSARSAAARVWENRCKVLCCCAGFDEHSQNAFSDVAQIIADFFKDVDLTPSDIAAGLALLQEDQDRHCISRDPMSIVTTQPQPHRDPRLEDLGLVAHYMKFAMAAYGWPLYVYTNPLTSLCQLSTECSCCSCTSGQVEGGALIMSDNCCRCHLAGILRHTGLMATDVVYATFHNKVYEIPFFVALDHDRRSVVVAVRGTLSLRDALTDLSAESETIDVEGVEGTFAHKGILQAAIFIHKKLEEENILANAFWKVPDYSLVVVGHSLGAGTASLLSILLRPAYPRLFCYAYSPPGGLMSKSTAEYTKNFTCSIVLGKDLVPRLGISTMEDLKSKLISAINSSDKPKYKILVGGVWYTLCGSADPATPSSTAAPSPNLTQPLLDEITGMPPGCGYTSQPDDTSLRRQGAATQPAPLYPPGHIIHIVEVEPASSCLSQPTYGAVLVDTDYFTNIIVNPKMLSDHMPDAVMKALDQLVQVQARGLQPFQQHCSQPVV